jgi:hypothetical protein
MYYKWSDKIHSPREGQISSRNLPFSISYLSITQIAIGPSIILVEAMLEGHTIYVTVKQF